MAHSFDPGRAQDFDSVVGPVTGVAFFRDAQGRYATFRGVNFAGRAKCWPYLPVDISSESQDFEADFEAAIADLQQQFDEIASLGWNVVRLLVMWKGLEPRPSPNPEVLLPEGEDYLRRIVRIIEQFHRRGVFVFLDFHQDIAHEVYNGDGLPDWALAIDDEHERPDDADFRHVRWSTEYTGAPLVTRHTKEVRHTLRSLWRNELHNQELSLEDQELARRPRTHLAKTIGAAARWLQANAGAARDAVIGYQVFNEPHQVGLGKPEFERNQLAEYYREVSDEIRRPAGALAGDDRAFVMIQPRVDWNVVKADKGDLPFPGLDFTLDPVTYLDTEQLDRTRTVFTYHHYDPWTPAQHAMGSGDRMERKQEEWPALYDKMRAAANERGLIPFITEFGANHAWDGHYTSLRPDLYRHRQTRAYIDLQMREADRQVLNWTYWHYNPYNTEEEFDGWNLEDFSLLGPGRAPRDHDLAARPYPFRSSAEPVQAFFDAGSAVFMLHLRGRPVDAPTVVYVPRALHYPSDFEVRSSSARVEWDEGRQLLYWWPDPAADQHLVFLSRTRLFGGLNLGLAKLLRLAPHRIRFPAGTVLTRLGIQSIVADPPGADIENELVLVTNPTDDAVDLTGWRLSDTAGHSYAFPAYKLAPRSTVTIWTRAGSDGANDLYMGRGAAIWNNPGDEAILVNAAGGEVSRYRY